MRFTNCNTCGNVVGLVDGRKVDYNVPNEDCITGKRAEHDCSGNAVAKSYGLTNISGDNNAIG